MSSKNRLELSKLSTKEFPYVKQLSREQEDMVNKLFKSQRVIVDSIAGSGKTVINTQAMKVLKDKGIVSKIYYVVFPVQEDALGHLPGGVGDKIREYAVPFFQALVTAGVNPQGLDLDRMCDEFSDCEYKVVPSSYLRGRTIADAGVIVDEIQNGSLDELQKALSRISDDCYVSMIGHNGQTDIKNSGYPAYLHHFKRGVESGTFTGIEFAHLTHNFRGEFSSFVDSIRQGGLYENTEENK